MTFKKLDKNSTDL